MVFKFSVIFLEKISWVPPPSEVEFIIDVAPCSKIISRVTYQMDLAELRELQA